MVGLIGEKLTPENACIGMHVKHINDPYTTYIITELNSNSFSVKWEYCKSWKHHGGCVYHAGKLEYFVIVSCDPQNIEWQKHTITSHILLGKAEAAYNKCPQCSRQNKSDSKECWWCGNEN